MALYRAFALLSVLLLSNLLAAMAAESCPAFASAASSCSAATCGRFVYRGGFREAAAKTHLLVPSAEGFESAGKVASPAACCQLCRLAGECAYWSFAAAGGKCALYRESLCAAEEVYEREAEDTYIGGFCGAPASAISLESKQDSGVKPLQEKPFCLISDKRLHINMLLGGYDDSRPGVSLKSKGIRSWIREIAIMWMMNGKTHTLHFGARRGSKKERAEGFLQFIKVDGTEVPSLALGDELNLFDGQAVVSFEAYERAGSVEVDSFRVSVAGLLDAELRVQPANPLLQLEDDALVHLSMDVLELEFTPTIHGVLGQTYRSDGLDQNLNYQTLSNLMYASPEDRDMAADTVDGIGANYLSSSVDAPDCDFSQFSSAALGVKLAFREASGESEDEEEEEIGEKMEEEMETIDRKGESEFDSEIGIETEADIDDEDDLKFDIGTERKLTMEAEAEIERQTATDIVTETDMESEYEIATESETGTEMGAEAELEMKPASEVEVGTETEAEIGVDLETGKREGNSLSQNEGAVQTA